MSQRISQHIILCEDRMHASLVSHYLKLCGINERQCIKVIASEQTHGGNITWVINRFPDELKAARQRHEAKSNTLLIAVIDADNHSSEARERDLQSQIRFAQGDPLVVLIPKRHIETWVCAAIQRMVTEEEDCKRHNLKRTEVREAAKQIHQWARHEPSEDSTCVPSLRVALPQWRRIG